jgi:hypothetical protein
MLVDPSNCYFLLHHYVSRFGVDTVRVFKYDNRVARRTPIVLIHCVKGALATN